MNISKDIARGLAIVAQIDTLKAELEGIESRLESIALGEEHLPLNDADREGRQAILQDGGFSLPVIFESDLIIGTLPDMGNAISIIRGAIPDQALLTKIWKPISGFARVAKDGQKYRQQLRALLTPEAATTVLQASIQRDKLGLPKSRTVIAWDRAQTPAKPAVQ